MIITLKAVLAAVFIVVAVIVLCRVIYKHATEQEMMHDAVITLGLVGLTFVGMIIRAYFGLSEDVHNACLYLALLGSLMTATLLCMIADRRK
jgi:heme A synthase